MKSHKDVTFPLCIHSSDAQRALIWATQNDTRMNETQNPYLSGVNGSQSNKDVCITQCEECWDTGYIRRP